MSEQNSELKLHALDYWQVIRNRYGVILLAFFLVFMTAAVITYMMPKQYIGKVQLQIHQSSETWQIFNDGGGAGYNNMITPNFIQTQFMIINSKETLYQVIDKMGLVERWEADNRQQAYIMLLDKIEAEEVRGTDLIDIIVYSTDPQEAADLANSIANAYVGRRSEWEKTRSKKALDTLDYQLTQQEEKVEQARIKMLNLM